MRAIGVDVGGSGVKAALVDLDAGDFVGERVRVDTPQPATPEAIVAATGGLLSSFPPDLPVGIGFPSPVVDGISTTAAHVDPSWVDAPARDLFARGLGREVVVLNDADAAGLAEARYGAAAGVPGVVIVLTLGTGIGSALINDGLLVPNTELGHLEVRGLAAEERAAARIRKERGLSWEQWAAALDEVITVIDSLFWPDLVLLGGGVSRRGDRFMHLLDARPPVRLAGLRNRAGIVGAAAHAAAT